jgi:hypothetical protein
MLLSSIFLQGQHFLCGAERILLATASSFGLGHPQMFDFLYGAFFMVVDNVEISLRGG